MVMDSERVSYRAIVFYLYYGQLPQLGCAMAKPSLVRHILLYQILIGIFCDRVAAPFA
ncbi:hypothetical protein [Moorena producens]|uniref:hypothetical protein n=1 Tax=Moorena producens TaxID=1155739 RepID=UPI001314526C|nr:hypothetical protein [Moorena producens]